MTRARNSANLASQGNLFVDIANDRTGIGSVAPAQNLHVAGTAGFHGDTTFVGDSYNVTWDRSENRLKFDEFSGIRLGNNNELQIDHRGTSYILNIDNMPLQIGSNSLQLTDASTLQNYLNASRNADVLLYRAGSERFRTKDYGVQITGTTDTDGLIVSGVATVTTMNVTGVLTYDDVTSVDSVGIVTARQGVRVTADGSDSSNYISVGAGGDLKLYHQSNLSFIKNITGKLVLRSDTFQFGSSDGTHRYIDIPDNEQGVSLFYDNVKHFETVSAGLNFAGSNADQLQWQKSNNLLKFRDGTKAVFGEGDDLQIHGGEGGTGAVINSANGDLFFRHGSDEQLILRDDGAVELYHDNSKKFQTNSTGATITNELEVEGIAVNDFESGRVRLTEHDHNFLGGYIHYDGNNNYMYMGVHPSNDTTVSNDVNAIKIHRTSNAEIELNYAGNKRLEITSGGVNIDGTTDGILNLDTTDSRGAFVRFGQGGSLHNMVGCADGLVTGLDKFDLAARAHDNFSIATNGDNEKLRITSGGQMRINTAGAPSADLHVGGTGAVLNAYFQTSSSTGAYHHYAIGNSGASLGYIGSARQISSSGQSAGFAMRSQDHIEFCTGGSTERVRITSGGRFLLGTSASRTIAGHSPRFTLNGDDYNAATLQITSNQNGSSGTFLQFSHQRSGSAGGNTILQSGDDFGRIRFTGGDGTNIDSRGAEIIAQVDGTPGVDDMPGRLMFMTTADGAQSTTERLRIDSDGNIWVNYGNPQSSSLIILDKDGNGEAAIRFYNASNNKAKIALDTSEELTFDVNGGERLRIDTNGRVGINDNDPDALFTVNNGNSDAQFVQMKNDEVGLFFGAYGAGTSYPREATINGSRVDSGSSPILRLAGQGGIKFCVDLNTPRMVITSAGAVMINKTTSFGTVPLQVVGASSGLSDGGQIFDIGTANGSAGTRLAFGVNEDNFVWIRGYESGVGGRDIVFAASQEKLRIKTDSSLLHTRTDNTTRYDVEFRNTGGISDGNYGGIKFTQGSSGQTALAALEIAYANTGRPDIVFRHRNRGGGTTFDEAMRITSNGAVGINTSKTLSKPFLHIAAPSQDFTNTSTQLMDGGGICLQTTNTLPSTGRNYPGIYWSGNTASLGRARAGIVGVAASNNDATDIVFLTREAANGTPLTPVDERMRIDKSGRLLLRTANTASNSKAGGFDNALQVEGTSATSASIAIIRNSSAENPPYLNFGKSRGTSVGSNTAVASGDNLGVITFNGSDGSGSFGSYASIYGVVDNTPGNSDHPGRLSFWTTPDGGTSPQERVRIDSNGDATFAESIYFAGSQAGISKDQGRLNVLGSGVYGVTIQHGTSVVLTNEQGQTTQAMVLGDTSSGTDGNALWGVSINNSTSDPTTGSESGWSEKARVEGNGDFVISGSVSASGSDDRLKKNKVGITSALSKVCAMEGFIYEWNDVADKIGMTDGEKHLGLSAQTVEPLVPEVVVINDSLVNHDDGTNDYKTIQYERLVPLLVEAIKDLKTENDSLKTRISALEGS